MVFFGKHKPRPIPSPAERDKAQAEAEEEWVRIDYDMMIRGSNVLRHGKPIKQIGVTVNGSTKLVTSGDLVDRQTFNALLAMNAIRVESRPNAPGAGRVISVLEEDREA